MLGPATLTDFLLLHFKYDLCALGDGITMCETYCRHFSMRLSTQSITTEWFTIGRKFGTNYAKMLSMVRQPFLYVSYWLTITRIITMA